MLRAVVADLKPCIALSIILGPPAKRSFQLGQIQPFHDRDGRHKVARSLRQERPKTLDDESRLSCLIFDGGAGHST
jgi:hypothetical protein